MAGESLDDLAKMLDGWRSGLERQGQFSPTAQDQYVKLLKQIELRKRSDASRATDYRGTKPPYWSASPLVGGIETGLSGARHALASVAAYQPSQSERELSAEIAAGSGPVVLPPDLKPPGVEAAETAAAIKASDTIIRQHALEQQRFASSVALPHDAGLVSKGLFLAGNAAPMLAPVVMSGPLAPAVAPALFGAQGFGEGYGEALAEGLPREQATARGAGYATLGAAAAIPFGGLTGSLVGTEAKGLATALARTGMEGALGAGAMGGQQLGENVVAQRTGSPERPTWQGVPQAAIGGGLFGAASHGVREVALDAQQTRAIAEQTKATHEQVDALLAQAPSPEVLDLIASSDLAKTPGVPEKIAARRATMEQEAQQAAEAERQAAEAEQAARLPSQEALDAEHQQNIAGLITAAKAGDPGATEQLMQHAMEAAKAIADPSVPQDRKALAQQLLNQKLGSNKSVASMLAKYRIEHGVGEPPKSAADRKKWDENRQRREVTEYANARPNQAAAASIPAEEPATTPPVSQPELPPPEAAAISQENPDASAIGEDRRTVREGSPGLAGSEVQDLRGEGVPEPAQEARLAGAEPLRQGGEDGEAQQAGAGRLEGGEVGEATLPAGRGKKIDPEATQPEGKSAAQVLDEEPIGEGSYLFRGDDGELRATHISPDDMAQMRAEVAKAAGSDIDLRFRHQIWARGETPASREALAAHGRSEPTELAGLSLPGAIEISLAQSPPEAIRTARHELGHHLIARLRPELQAKVIEDIGTLAPRNGTETKKVRRARLEETFCDALAKWWEGNPAPTPALARAFRAIRRMFDSIGEYLRSKGFHSVADVFGTKEGAAGRRLERVYEGMREGEHARSRGTPDEAYDTKAFHGSPHDFDKFELSDRTVGTGEGAQAYGHGLYFAGDEAVGREYRNRLAREIEILVDGRPADEARLTDYSGADRSAATAEQLASDTSANAHDAAFTTLRLLFARGLRGDRLIREAASQVGRAADTQASGDMARELISSGRISVRPKGHLYKVSLKPEADEWLDWDKPLSEQSEKVKKGLAVALGPDLDAEGLLPSDRGELAYRRVVGKLREQALRGKMGKPSEPVGLEAAASKALHAAGIPGIRYLDGNSRFTSGGEILSVDKTPEGWRAKIRVPSRGGGYTDQSHDFTTSRPFKTEAEARAWAEEKVNGGRHNYVVFDDSHVSIEEKYQPKTITHGESGEKKIRNVELKDGKFNYEYWSEADKAWKPESRSMDSFQRATKPVGRASTVPPKPPSPPATGPADARPEHPADGPTFSLRDKKALEGVERAVVDNLVSLKLIQEDIQKSGRTVRPETNAYLAREAMGSKIKNDFDIFMREEVTPLMKEMKSAGVSVDDLGQYLYARHAKEANDYIASINPEKPDGGSGMTNAEAADIIRSVESGPKARQLKALAEKSDAIVEGTRKLIEKAGLETPSTVESWRQAYKNYVPLKGSPEAAGTPRTGGMGGVKGPEAKARTGRFSAANNPFVQLVTDRMEKVIRAQKNSANEALLKLAEEHPNDEAWAVFSEDHPDRTRRIKVWWENPETGAKSPKPKTGWVRQARVEPTAKQMAMYGSEYVGVKRNGKQFYIGIRDERLREALTQRADLGDLGKVLSAIRVPTKLFSQLHTSLSPAFMVVNFPRDLMIAGATLVSERGKGGKLEGQNQSALRMAKSAVTNMPAVWDGLRGRPNPNPETARLWKEFREDGGMTDWFDAPTFDKTMQQLKEMVENKHPVRRAVSAPFRFLRSVNDIVENATRFAVYTEVRKGGGTRQEAATLAKNATANFERHGTLGPQMNALYAFSNAGIQGAKTGWRLTQTTNGRRILVGVAGLGATLGAYNSMVSKKGKDGFSAYDKIPDWEKANHLIIMMPNGEQHIRIPLPPELRAIHAIGTSMADMATGTKTPAAAGIATGEALLNSLSPIGESQGKTPASTAVKTALPTLARPVGEIAFNENYYGAPVYPESKARIPPPDSSMSQRDTPEAYKKVARLLNSATRGNESKPGFVDVHPESIEYLVNEVVGGFIKEAQGAATTADSIAHGKTPEGSRIPLARKFLGLPNSAFDRLKFQEREVSLLQDERHAKTLKGAERQKAVDAMALAAVKSARKRIDSLYDQKRAVEARTPASPQDAEQLLARSEKLDEQIEQEYERFNKLYNERVGKNK